MGTPQSIEGLLLQFGKHVQEQANDGSASAQTTLDWAAFQSDTAEVFMPLPTTVEEFVEFAKSMGRTMELFFMARALSCVMNTGEAPTHINLKLEASLESV